LRSTATGGGLGRFPALPELASAQASEIEDAIRVGGLYVRKARIIRQIARRALQEPVSLDEMDNERAREYLKSLDGVGSKTASCVLLFALGREVFPVDTHVFRLTKRLGLLDEAVPFDRADEALEEFVPGGIRYDLHINLIQHGRGVCRPSRPRCRGCVLLDLCPHGRRMEGMDQGHD
jgi:endonuclease-3